MTEIETKTLLADDLPAEIASRAYPEDKLSNFVLAGRCGDLPIYKQV